MHAVPLPCSPRDRVLDGATELFAVHGYPAISLRDLARHTGLAAGSLYHHIESKQALLFELIEATLQDLIFTTQRALGRASGNKDCLRLFVATFLQFHEVEQHRIALVQQECRYLDSHHRCLVEELKKAYLEILGDVMVRLAPDSKASPALLDIKKQAIIELLFTQSRWCSPFVAASMQQDSLLLIIEGIVSSGHIPPMQNVG